MRMLLGCGFGLVVTFWAHAALVVQDRAGSLPRTAWGTPDFQGIAWDFATMTPLERPVGVDKPEFTEAEAAAFQKQTSARQEAGNINGPSWWDEGSQRLDRRRTSLITDPPDGRIPVRPREAQKRGPEPPRAAGRAADGPESYSLNARCVWWPNTGPPMVPGPYNNIVEFFQTRDYVAILNENMHEVRVIPMDGRPHGQVRQWLGDSRGRWEGNSLVVDTTSFSEKTSLRGSSLNLHLVERFTRLDAETIEYQFTADDPTVWSRPWTATILMHRAKEPVIEFACHEGNARSMEGMLRGARATEKASAEAGR